MALYKGQQASGAVENVTFVRARGLMAVGDNMDYVTPSRTIAGRNDLLPMIEIGFDFDDADTGRLIVDSTRSAIAIISGELGVGIPRNREARSNTGDLVRKLNPGYKVLVDYEGIGPSPERR